MQQKYADVVSLAQVEEYVFALPDNLFPTVLRIAETERECRGPGVTVNSYLVNGHS